MTRAAKYNWSEIEYVYVHDISPKPISIDGLVEQYGVTRSLVAQHALTGGWAKKRADFRQVVGQKVIEASGDSYIGYATAQQEKVIQALVKTLDRYIERLDAGEIQPQVKDLVAVSAALRVYISDRLAQQPQENQTADPETIQFETAEELRGFIERVQRGELRALPSGQEVDHGLPDAGTGS